jgi:hypothetical protein
LAFFPVAFVGLLAVSVISGVGGTFHIIVYDLYPTFKRFWASLRAKTVASESQKLIK